MDWTTFPPFKKDSTLLEYRRVLSCQERMWVLPTSPKGMLIRTQDSVRLTMSLPGKLHLCLILATVNQNGKQIVARRLVPAEAGTKFSALHSRCFLASGRGGTYSFPFLPKALGHRTGTSSGITPVGWLPFRPVSRSILKG